MPTIEPLKQAPPGTASGASRTVLFLTVFIDLLGFGIVIPFLPMFAERVGVGAVGIGLVLAIYSLMQFLCAPILGRISDRVGRRPIIMIGLLGSSVSYFIYGFANSFFLLMLSRAIHGACAATVSTAQAYIADTTGGEDRARGMGLIGAAFGLGFVLGPAIGGILGAVEPAHSGVFRERAHLRKPDLRGRAAPRIAHAGPHSPARSHARGRSAAHPPARPGAASARALVSDRVSDHRRTFDVGGDVRVDGAGGLRLCGVRRRRAADVRGADAGDYAGLPVGQDRAPRRRGAAAPARNACPRNRPGAAGKPWRRTPR